MSVTLFWMLQFLAGCPRYHIKLGKCMSHAYLPKVPNHEERSFCHVRCRQLWWFVTWHGWLKMWAMKKCWNGEGPNTTYKGILNGVFLVNLAMLFSMHFFLSLHYRWFSSKILLYRECPGAQVRWVRKEEVTWICILKGYLDN